MNSNDKTIRFVDFSSKLSYRYNFTFSYNPDLIDDGIENEPDQITGIKPTGLWYSKGPAWISFLSCGFNLHNSPRWTQWTLGKYNSIYRLRLHSSNMLFIKTNEELKRFNKRYRKDKSNEVICWNNVIDDEYHGIYIRWQGEEIEQAYPWYNGWDCSSGCIWNGACIKSIEPVKRWLAKWNESNEPQESNCITNA